MTDTRKTITFKLPVAAEEAFKRAKEKAERELGISLKDNEFARRVVVQGVRGMPQLNISTGKEIEIKTEWEEMP